MSASFDTPLDLKWIQVRRRAWSERTTWTYTKGGYNAVIYHPYDGSEPFSVSFLHDLPKLRGVHLAGEAALDTTIFRLAGLQLLILETRPMIRLDFGQLDESLLSLTASWQHGLSSITGAANLRDLTVDDFAGHDLSFVGALPKLTSIRLAVPRRHKWRLTGLGGLTELGRLWIEDGMLDPTDQVRLPESIEELVFNGSRGLNISFIRDLPKLRRLCIENCGEIPGIGSLAEHPALEVTENLIDVDWDRLFTRREETIERSPTCAFRL